MKKELDYPLLVTPTVKIAGTQAVFNVVMDKERYEFTSKEVKNYLKSIYGKPAGLIKCINIQLFH